MKDTKFNPPIRSPSYYRFNDKERCIQLYCDLMFNRTQTIFDYEGLPDTIPQYFLENYLQRNGECCITEINGELYAFTGGLGGEWNEYYYPTIYVVANPYLNFSKSLVIGKDCVFFKNDSNIRGLTDVNSKYATLLAESDITMRNANVLRRLPAIAAVHGDQQKEGLDELTDRIEQGSTRIAISDDIFGSLKTLPFSSAPLTELVEYHQYIKGMWYNELGIKSSFNMKREALNDSETSMNDDMLIPLIEDMLKCREEAVAKVNEMYGTKITVKLNSIWEKQEELNEIELELAKAEIANTEDSEPIEENSETSEEDIPNASEDSEGGKEDNGTRDEEEGD